MPVSSDWVIRPYVDADYAGVWSVLTASYGDRAGTEALFKWWTFGCPIASSGFMVAEANGRVVGLQPMAILPFAIGAEVLKGGVLTSVAVHPDYRRRGLFTALVRGCEQEAWRQGADFVTTMPNDLSHPGFLKLGYLDLGRRCLLAALLDARRLAEAGVRPRWLRGPAGAVGKMWNGLFVHPRNPRAHAVQPVTRFDPALGELERAHARLFPGLRVERNEVWWQWRYLRAPERSYLLMEARTAKGALAGVGAATTEVRGGLPIGYLMDFAVRDPDALRDLVHGILAELRRRGAALVGTILSLPALIEALQSLGLRRVPDWLPVKRFHTVCRVNPTREAEVTPRVRQVGQWHLTLGDWDTL